MLVRMDVSQISLPGAMKHHKGSPLRPNLAKLALAQEVFAVTFWSCASLVKDRPRTARVEKSEADGSKL
jgi:hypothetical protein